MSSILTSLDGAMVEQYCRQLRLPTVASHYEQVAKEAVETNQTHISYLAELLGAEVEDRERRTVERRLREARLPRLKTLEEFDFQSAPHLPAVRLRELASGSYIEQKEPVIFLGDSGTGKTHLASGLCVAACRQKRRCRFITAASLVNELIEAQHHNQLGRMLERWTRYELIVLDEVGYVPFAQVGSELLFQIISERSEKATLIITTNLPFGEWTQVFPNSRLCKALLDRVTDRAHIIETGTESYRFRRTMESRKKSGKKRADG